MDESALEKALNGLTKEDYAREMGLEFWLDLDPAPFDAEDDMELVGRLNTLYGGPGGWPGELLRALAENAVGARGLSEGDGIAAIGKLSARESDLQEKEVWAVPYLTASSRADLEEIAAHDAAMPTGRFARSVAERIAPSPKLGVMPGYIESETVYGDYDPFLEETEAWEEFRVQIDKRERLEVDIDPARADKILEAIDDLEGRGIQFERIAPIAPTALLKLSELAQVGVFECYVDLEPYMPYIPRTDPRAEKEWILLGSEFGQRRDPEDGDYIDVESNLYYLPESGRFFLEHSDRYFLGGSPVADALVEMSSEDAYRIISRYAAGDGERYSIAALPFDSPERYHVENEGRAGKVIATLSAESFPDRAVRVASDGETDLWHLEDLDWHVLADSADLLSADIDMRIVSAAEAQSFKRRVEEDLDIPGEGHEGEFFGDIAQVPTTEFFYGADGDIHEVNWKFDIGVLEASHLLDRQKYVVEFWHLPEFGDAPHPVLCTYDEKTHEPQFPADPIKVLTFQELCEELRSRPGLADGGITSFDKLESLAQQLAAETLDRDEKGDLIPDQSRWVPLDERSAIYRYDDFGPGDLNHTVTRLYRMPDSDRFFVEEVGTYTRDGLGGDRINCISMHELEPESAYRRICSHGGLYGYDNCSTPRAIVESESYGLNEDPLAQEELGRLASEHGPREAADVEDPRGSRQPPHGLRSERQVDQADGAMECTWAPTTADLKSRLSVMFDPDRRQDPAPRRHKV